MSRIRVWGVSLAGVLTLAGTMVGMAPALADTLGWTTCPPDVVVPPGVVMQCASVPVPLDYGKPEGAEIDIMISRVASTQPDERRGVLLTNPGGPGSAGLSFPGDLIGRGLPASITDAYDVIGMDHRGVGHSSPVNCGLTYADQYFSNVPPYAVGDAAVIAQAAIAKAVAAKCAANDKNGQLRHVTTANIARDLDRIRLALGETKASFLGISYGSALGAAYASLFPSTTDRIVVDSIIGGAHLDRDALRRFGLGFEQTFPAFAEWAAARHGAYGLGRTPTRVRQNYFSTAGRPDRTPAADGTDGAVFRFRVLLGLYGEANYPGLARYWQGLQKSGPAPAEAAADEPNPADNSLSAFLGVVCNDVDWPEDVATYRKAVAQDRKRYPMYGPAAANILPCAFWKYEPTEPAVAINNEGPANVLILQHRRDPATPLAGGKLLRQKFGDRARLVSVDGSGHGVYLYGGNACALDITTAYLAVGRLPTRDISCSD